MRPALSRRTKIGGAAALSALGGVWIVLIVNSVVLPSTAPTFSKPAPDQARVEPRPVAFAPPPGASPAETPAPLAPPAPASPEDDLAILRNASKDVLIPPVIHIDAELAPGSVPTSEALVPPTITLPDPELAPGSAPTRAPLVPPVIEATAKPAEP